MFDEEMKIKEVKLSGDYYSISTDQGTGFGLDKKYGITPRVGDTVKIYTVHGSEIRGIDLNGKSVFYKSDKQLEQERREWLKSYEKEKKETFKKNKAQMDRDYQSLPKEFKLRIDRFRSNNPKFRVDYESYEMFVCNEAVKIAEACGTPEKVQKFQHASWEQQKEMFPGLDDGHSGNTFGAACVLAYVYLSKPEKVSQIRGSLSPLVGSKAFGDIKPNIFQKILCSIKNA